MKHRYSSLTAAILSVMASPGFAETTETAEAAALPEVTVTGAAQAEERTYAPVLDNVGSRLPAALKDTPQSVTVINEAVLDDQAATSLVEALRNVPGITISAGEGGNIGDSINLRGFSARTDIFLDGLRDRGQYSRDVFSLNAVEVLKGPSSMLFGRGSTGGVINQVSKRPSLKDGSELSVSVGTDDYYRSTFDTNKKLSDTSAARVAVFWQDIGTDRDRAEKTGMGVAPSLRLGIGQPTEVTVSALVQSNRDIPDYGGPLLRSTDTVSTAKPVNIGKNFYGYADDHFDQDVNALNLGIRHKFNEHVTLRNQTQFSRVDIEASPTPLGSVEVVGTNAEPCKTAYGTVPLSSIPLSCLKGKLQDKDRAITDTSLFNLTDLTFKFNTGAVKHTLITGFELGADKYENYTRAWPNGTAVVTTTLDHTTQGVRPGPALPKSLTKTEATSAAAYVNEQLDLTEQWTVVAGLRFDRFEADTTSENFALPATHLPSNWVVQKESFSTVDEMLSTRAGLIFKPDATQSYYVSYGTSFNPTAEALTISSAQSQLEPEKNVSYELGGKWTFADEAVLLNASVFRVEKKNARTTDPFTSEVTLDGDVRVDGFETSVTGQISPEWQVIGGYTFLNSEVLESNDRTTIPLGGADKFTNGVLTTQVGALDPFVYSKGKDYQNTPRHSATLWTTYRVTPSWQLGAGATGTSDRFVNNFETAEIDGYVRGDAMVAFLQPSYDVRLNVQNVTDKLYYETASQGRATAAMGRRFILTGTYRF